MANYQELLSKAVGALPENNGASRREVYEKARKALVAQLRSISPSLPAREITQHRLELEDCIRQVEHEATEALLGGLKELDEETISLVDIEPPAAPVEPEVIASPETQAEPVPENRAALNGAESSSNGAGSDVALAEKPVAAQKTAEPEVGSKVAKERPQSRAMANAEPTSIDAIIARAEAAREQTAREAAEKQSDIAARRQAQDEAEAMTTAEKLAIEEEAAHSGHGQTDSAAETAKISAKSTEENPSGPDHQARAHLASDAAVGAAMSRVREVEVEAPVLSRAAPDGPTTRKEPPAVNNIASARATSTPPDDPQEDEAQLAVDRAIQVLDREARGEHDPLEGGDVSLEDALNSNRNLTSGEARFNSEGEEEKRGNALTIFLVLAVVLLGAVGGGGYWAWREGYVDLDALFASTETPPIDASTPLDGGTQEPQTSTPPVRDVTADAQNPGPGNTTTDVEPGVPEAEIETAPVDNKIDERLPSTGTDPSNPAASEPASNGDKVEDRLSTDGQPELTVSGQNGDTADAAITSSGAQSLLLEASSDGTTGAVPFSGTVEWSRGVDELGQPTLIATAKIPARNLGVTVLIRRNADPSLPASHLMEIEFDVSETFSGGAVAGLPGILLKNEELVQGAALVGASARVVGNSFLFALSAAEQDVRNNISLLESNKWMDLAIVFATGRRAIITLEKDAGAEAMFNDVLAAWRAADDSAGSNG